MIYITGDSHGDPKLFLEHQRGENTWQEGDIVVFCGDFGYVRPSAREFLNELEEKPYTIAFCDGNHECFPEIEKYPVQEWKGGKVRFIRKNIIHLMRGQVYTIEGQTFFTFGGAFSIDWWCREKGVTWFPTQELPTAAEREEAWKNLHRHGNKVDYIITHTVYPEKVKRMLLYLPYDLRPKLRMNLAEAPLMDFLSQVGQKVQFRHWYFGHWHFDLQIDEQFTAVLKEVYPLPTVE